MTRWRNLLAGGVVLASAAAAQQPPAATPAVLAGVRACAGAMAAGRVDEARLTAAGWSKAVAASADGKPVSLPTAIYGRDNVLILLAPGQPGCGITAPIAGVPQFREVQAAFQSAFGAPVQNDGKGHIVHRLGTDKFVQFGPSGTKAAPAVRIIVAPR